MSIHSACGIQIAQRKYVNCCFFLEPPSPYSSFHCLSSPIMAPSAAKLAATCISEFRSINNNFELEATQLFSLMLANAMRCSVLLKSNLNYGFTWFFASFKSVMFSGLRMIGSSFSFFFVESDGAPPFSRFSFS